MIELTLAFRAVVFFVVVAFARNRQESMITKSPPTWRFTSSSSSFARSWFTSTKHTKHHVTVPRYPGEYCPWWREEITIADQIVVISNWSADCLRRSGVPVERPLDLMMVYESPDVPPRRCFPSLFPASRPLPVLCPNQVILRKGVAHLLSAADRLRDAPGEIRLVGTTEVSYLRDLVAGRQNVTCPGAVLRSAVDRRYAEADVLVLPTHSDGFALAQLDAILRGLPVIATRCSGEVVVYGENGLFLPAVAPEIFEANPSAPYQPPGVGSDVGVLRCRWVPTRPPLGRPHRARPRTKARDVTRCATTSRRTARKPSWKRFPGRLAAEFA